MISSVSAQSAWLLLQARPRKPQRSSSNFRPSAQGGREAAAAQDKSRRRILSQLALGVAAVALATGIPAQPAAALPGFKKDLKPRRKLEIPDDAYTDGPEGLKYYDVVAGTGAEALVGERVVVHFDAKWRGITFVTMRQGMGVTVGAKVGAGGTLKGLDLGVRGMRVGGQRRLLVPANLAYGKRGYGEIPPDATLTVDVALLSIKGNAIGTRLKLVEG